MGWSDVGKWIENNAGKGAALVGSLVTGNIPGAVAAGVAMVSSATGTNDPKKALAALKADPATLLRLKELALKNDESIRGHMEEMTRLKLEDAQKEHETTQETIRGGDKAEDAFVRRTRPGQSWCSLIAAFTYVFCSDHVDFAVLGMLMALPLSYAGLRQIGKGIDSKAIAKVSSAKGNK